LGLRLKGIELKSRESTQPAWTPGGPKPERRLATLDDADEVKTAADIRYDDKVKDEKEAEERKEEEAVIRLSDAFDFASKIVSRFNRDCPAQKGWKLWSTKLKELSADLILQDEANRLPSLPALIAALAESHEQAASWLWADVKREAQRFKADVIPPLKPNYKFYLNRLIPALRKYTGDTRNFQILPDRDRELWGAELLQYCFYLVSSKRKGDNIFWETSTTDDTVSEFAVRMLERIFTPRKDDPKYRDEVPYVECGKLRGFMTGVWETFKKSQKELLLTDELIKAASLQSDTGDGDLDLQNRNGTLAEDVVSYATEANYGPSYCHPETGKLYPSPAPSDMLTGSQKVTDERKATWTDFEDAELDRLVAKKVALAAAKRKATTTAEREALTPERKALTAERKSFVRSMKNKRKANKKRGTIDIKAAADFCPLPGTIADICASSEWQSVATSGKEAA
jgi:hypothetical protein